MPIGRADNSPGVRRTPNLPGSTAAKPSAPAGDYTVAKGDTLWGIAKTMLEQGGTKATNRAINKAMTELKAANPELCTPARDYGNKLKVGDAITFPVSAGWKATPGAAERPSTTEQAQAQTQMAQIEAAKLAEKQNVVKSLSTQLDQLAAYPAALNEAQRGMAASLLESIETHAPELLETAAGKALIARLSTDEGAVGGPDSLPQFPGVDATEEELAQFESQLEQVRPPRMTDANPATAVTAPPAPAVAAPQAPSGPAAPAAPAAAPAMTQWRSMGGDIADQAISAIGQLKEPKIPGPDATPQELAQYEKDTKRHDRMMELMTNIIKKRDELQMSIIRKI